jgi:2,3-diketo-5-methylthiopentyl-1-phosphate enolase
LSEEKPNEIPIEAQPQGYFDGLDTDKYVIGFYFAGLNPALPIIDVAEMAALEQSTGTWTPVPGETIELKTKRQAKVLGIWETPEYVYSVPKEVDHRNFIIAVGFPWENFGTEIPMLLSTVVGNLSMGGRIKLMDLWFPKQWLKAFKGPKHGLQGIRDIMDIPKRPLLNNMIKPKTGYTPEVGAELFYGAAVGGTDCIKDDEIIANPHYNKIEDRVPLYMEKAEKANQEKNEKTLYCCNITSPVDKLLENADKVKQAGGNALLINYLAVGYDALRMVAEEPNTLPIMGHMDIAGAWSYSPITGVSPSLIMSKLPRIAGSDITLVPAPYGKAPLLDDKFLMMAKRLQFPLQNIKPSMPMPSGGITAGHVEKTIRMLGLDIMIEWN